ncbi:MAG: response regulator transcription factor [Gammaproteobacteria bacterium]
MPTSVLIVDDDVALCALLRDYLQEEGFDARVAHDGTAALDLLRTAPPDIVLLDVMMPGMNGFDVLRALRAFSRVPVLMLTARGEEIDRIVGLEIGADDYVGKPCNPREIVARLRAILRRARPAPAGLADGTLTVGDLVVRTAERRAWQAGTPLDLTSSEYAVLEVLVRHAGRLVTKAELSEQAFQRKFGRFDRALDMHVSRLRRKLGSAATGEERIRTARGLGYQYVIPTPPP